MAGIAEIVSGIFKPISDVIDHVTASGDQKIALQMAVLQGNLAAAQAVTDYEKQLLAAQSSVITAEAQGNSWIQRSWRPITMLTFLALVVCDSFSWLPSKLAPQAWSLLQIGLGGYTVGRTVEKVMPSIVSTLKGK